MRVKLKLSIARARGLTVIGTASTEEGRALVLKEGAHYGIAAPPSVTATLLTVSYISCTVFDHKATNYIAKVKELAASLGGINLILEMLANINLAKVYSIFFIVITHCFNFIRIWRSSLLAVEL
jgi:hypothetical protein